MSIALKKDEDGKPRGANKYCAIYELEFLCPVCSAVNDFYEAVVNGAGTLADYECVQCDAKLEVTAHVNVDVSTKVREREALK